jgi:hypothetical protein
LYTRFVAAARAQAPDQFRWRHEPYEFVRDPIAIDLLYGSDRERLAIEEWSEEEFQAITHAWEAEEAAFRARCAPHLLYKV